jgi:hypothetical protein
MFNQHGQHLRVLTGFVALQFVWSKHTPEVLAKERPTNRLPVLELHQLSLQHALEVDGRLQAVVQRERLCVQGIQHWVIVMQTRPFTQTT